MLRRRDVLAREQDKMSKLCHFLKEKSMMSEWEVTGGWLLLQRKNQITPKNQFLCFPAGKFLTNLKGNSSEFFL